MFLKDKYIIQKDVSTYFSTNEIKLSIVNNIRISVRINFIKLKQLNNISRKLIIIPLPLKYSFNIFKIQVTEKYDKIKTTIIIQ